ncbi:unnamed protein product, partial [Cuscuta epithymum]
MKPRPTICYIYSRIPAPIAGTTTAHLIKDLLSFTHRHRGSRQRAKIWTERRRSSQRGAKVVQQRRSQQGLGMVRRSSDEQNLKVLERCKEREGVALGNVMRAAKERWEDELLLRQMDLG